MKAKTANRFFLIFVILALVGAVFLEKQVTFLSQYQFCTVVRYLFCFLLGYLLVKKDGGQILQVLPYNVPLKGKTVLYTILSALLFMPLMAVLSAVVSMLSGDMLSLFAQQSLFDPKNGFTILFSVAVVPAVFEELFFRGFFFQPYKDAKGPRYAIILSAILFGLIHMNFQQSVYATLLGVIMGILREVTGSMWAGTLYHFVNNSWSALILHISYYSKSFETFYAKMPLSRIGFDTSSQIRHTVGLVIVSTAVAVYLLYKIAQNEGREADLKNFFRDQKADNEKAVTAPLVIGILLLLLVTFFISYLLMNMPDQFAQAMLETQQAAAIIP